MKDATIADLLVFSSGFPQWNVVFIRVAQDWKLEAITKFYVLLYSVSMTEGTIDKMN